MELLCKKIQIKSEVTGLKDNIFIEYLVIPTIHQPIKLSESIIEKVLKKVETKKKISSVDVMHISRNELMNWRNFRKKVKKETKS